MGGVSLTLTRPQAAALCNLTPSGFDGWVRKGIVPGPIAGTRRWSRAALERALSSALVVADVELDPFEQWEAERTKTAKIAASVASEILPLGKPLGKREREVLADIYAGGGREMDVVEVRNGPATWQRLADRKFIISDHHGFRLRLTKAGTAAHLASIGALK